VITAAQQFKLRRIVLIQYLSAALSRRYKSTVMEWPVHKTALYLKSDRDHCHMLWEGSTPATFTYEGTQGRGASTGRTQRSHCEGGTSSIIKGGRRKDGKEGGRKSTISSSLSSTHCSYTTSTLCLRCVYLFTLLVTLQPDKKSRKVRILPQQ
jgi:hypothetical protein